MPEAFRIAVSKDYLVFSSAHFITMKGHHCEALHGHNYRVGIAVEGPLDAESLFVIDFSVIKQIARRLVDAIDHRVLLPTGNPKIDAMRVDEVRAAVNRIVDQVEGKLKEHTDDARRLRILKVETTEHGELKAKFAFLVQRSGFEEFRDAAEQLAREHQSAGVRLELTGPWPVYNFIQL